MTKKDEERELYRGCSNKKYTTPTIFLVDDSNLVLGITFSGKIFQIFCAYVCFLFENKLWNFLTNQLTTSVIQILFLEG